MSAPAIYPLLSALIGYPNPATRGDAEACLALLDDRHPDAAVSLRGFLATIAGRSLPELEEAYARIFDLNPSRCLDLGYQIFGETYKRGAFLVKMKAATEEHGVDPGSELFDHLTATLILLPRLGAGDDPEELAVEIMLPVIDKVLRTFEEDEGGYRSLLRAVELVMMRDYGVTKIAEIPAPSPVSASSDHGGRKLPMFPGFSPPTERPWP
ncbi:MAG: hypothetical protein U0359_17555 [Byssovorax sp.]